MRVFHAALFIFVGAPLTAQVAVSPVRISLDYNGAEAYQGSYLPLFSSDERYVLFSSFAPLSQADLNGLYDVYLFDRQMGGPPELVSVNTSGMAGNKESKADAAISADNRFVAFASDATDLGPSVAPFGTYIYVRDRLLGTTQLISQSTTGVAGACFGKVAMSGDGRYVVFSSASSSLALPDNNGTAPDVLIRDRLLGTTAKVSVSSLGIQGNSASGALEPLGISADGRFVCFMSASTNLVANDANGQADVFLHDRTLGTTTLVSVSSNGQQGDDWSFDCQLSPDGRFVVFSSNATNLVTGDTNSTWDVFRRDVISGTTIRVSIDDAGVEANDRSEDPAISPDGRFVHFLSRATNLVSGDTNAVWDCFMHDCLRHTTVRTNVNSGNVQGNAEANAVCIGRDGRTVGFSGAASNLVAGDTNMVSDVFVRQWPKPVVYCTAKTNSIGCISSISTSGVPTASFSQGFVISASNVLNQKLGLLIYSTVGATAQPFHGGILCIQPPFRRTPHQTSGGSSSGADCTGVLSYDFNTWIASGADVTLIAGRRVWAQFWSRDPGFAPPGNSNVTDAVTFEVDP